MDDRSVNEAVDLLAALRAGRSPVVDLGPAGPRSVDEGHRVQDALLRRLGEPIAGWKVAGVDAAGLMRGAILATRLLPSGAMIRPSDAPLLGIELEIAFRLDRDLPSGIATFDRATLAEFVTALPAIEVVDTRFANYHAAPLHHRLADMMSNAFLVTGKPFEGWRALDLVTIGTRLAMGDEPVRTASGGHSAGDPLLPVLAFVNSAGKELWRAGQIVTAGTYTGLGYARPGMTIKGEFAGLGAVELSIGAD